MTRANIAFVAISTTTYALLLAPEGAWGSWLALPFGFLSQGTYMIVRDWWAER